MENRGERTYLLRTGEARVKRGSRIAIVIGLVAIGAVAGLYASSGEYRAPKMTIEMANSLVKSGCETLARADAAAMLSVVAADARILGMDRTRLEEVLDRTFTELGGRLLIAEPTNLVLSLEREQAMVAFDIRVSEKLRDADAIYFNTRMRLQLARVKTSRLFGLAHGTEWQILSAECNPPIEIPDR